MNGLNYYGGSYAGGLTTKDTSNQQRIGAYVINSSITVVAPKAWVTRQIIAPTVITSTSAVYAPIIRLVLIVVRPAVLHSTTNIFKPNVSGYLVANDTAPDYTTYRRTFLPIRDIAAGVQISFSRTYDAAASFFTVGSSAMDGGDVFQGNGSTIQEWDKFDYTDYSDYLRSIEYHYEQDVIGGMVLGYTDFALMNKDNMFSPYEDTPISANIAPNRPVKLHTGFKDRKLQTFAGQTMRVPETDRYTAKFHAKDFIASFADKRLETGRTYLNVTTDYVINDILQNDAGLSPTQYSLDVGVNTIGFLHIKPDTTIGEVFRRLMQAELGRLYQDYDGAIAFKNRNSKTRTTAIKLRESYVYHEEEPEIGNVINRVKITSDVREVQASQQVFPTLKDGSNSQYEDFSSFEIAAGETVTKFFDFDDPVTSFTHPTIGGGIEANSASDGTGVSRNADLSYSVVATFTTSVKYSFTNNSATPLYVVACTIQGTPAKIVRKIRVEVKDQPSIDKYGEQELTIDNDCFTDNSFTTTTAQKIVTENKDAPNIRELTIKAIPYLAVGDVITHYDGTNNIVDMITGKISPQNGYTQTIRLRKTA